MEEPSSCWNGARYFRYLTNVDPDIDSPDAYSYQLNPEEMVDWEDEIYNIVQTNSFEAHYFTLVLSGNDLKLYQTYGGVERITVLMFEKEIWIIKYIDSTEGDVDAYNYCFGLCVKGIIADFSGHYDKV